MKLFYTILDREVQQFPNGIMSSWNRPQRDSKERSVAKYCGLYPRYRVNLRLKNHFRSCGAQDGYSCTCPELLTRNIE